MDEHDVYEPWANDPKMSPRRYIWWHLPMLADGEIEGNLTGVVFRELKLGKDCGTHRVYVNREDCFRDLIGAFCRLGLLP